MATKGRTMFKNNHTKPQPTSMTTVKEPARLNLPVNRAPPNEVLASEMPEQDKKTQVSIQIGHWLTARSDWRN